jgi:uncharacterized membrane protein YedE/YeeE
MSRTRRRLRPAVVVFGAALGFVLSRLGFTDAGEVHRMMTFVDLRLIGAFAVAVVVTAVGLRVTRVSRVLPAKPWHAGLVPGAALFGLGWAVSGVCPGAAFAQLGEGNARGVVGVVGVVVGSALFHAWQRYGRAVRRDPFGTLEHEIV